MSNCGEQRRYLREWFQTWSDYQKEDFLVAFARKITAKGALDINGLTDGLEQLSNMSRPPSLFNCQQKLFGEWWDSWNEADRGKFTDDIKNMDAKFWNELEDEINGTRKKEFDDYFKVPDVENVPVQASNNLVNENVSSGSKDSTTEHRNNETESVKHDSDTNQCDPSEHTLPDSSLPNTDTTSGEILLEPITTEDPLHQKDQQNIEMKVDEVGDDPKEKEN